MALTGLTLAASRVQPFPRPDFSLPGGQPVRDVAAAEGLDRGYDYFEITHLRDRNYASAGRLFAESQCESRARPGAGHAGPLYAGSQDPIGSYAALAESRYERDWSAAPRAWTHPGLTAVIEYTNEPPTRYRERFEAGEVYRNLVSDGGLE